MLPGFIDNHFHVMQTAVNMMSVDLGGARSHRELGEMLAAAEKREGAVLGCQVEESQFEEKRFPDRYVLDRYCSDSPVVLFSKEYHVSMLNTHALLYYKVPFSLEGVGWTAAACPRAFSGGTPTMCCAPMCCRSLPDEFRMEAIHLAMSRLLENGITTVAAIEGGWLFDDRDAGSSTPTAASSRWICRCSTSTMGLAKVWKLGLRRVGGNIMVDGTLSSQRRPVGALYADRPDYRGQIFPPRTAWTSSCSSATGRICSWRCTASATEAIESVLLTHESAIRQGGSTALRHRIEHAIMATPEQIARAADMKLIFRCSRPTPICGAAKGGMYERRVGERYLHSNNFAAMFAAGAVVCGGSDSDVTEPRPMLGIHAAVNRAVPQCAVVRGAGHRDVHRQRRLRAV